MLSTCCWIPRSPHSVSENNHKGEAESEPEASPWRPIWRRSAQHDDNGGHPRSGNTRNRCWHRVRVETNGCT
ncbi:unnamed protein product, partial [Gulo gulo]